MSELQDESISEAELRAGTYLLLARLLAAPPDAETLDRLRDIHANSQLQDPMAKAWLALKQAAQETQVESVDDEYHVLFIGLGRGELVPYGSWYKSGFLMEKPLGDLRRDLAALGYERDEQVREPEDHAAALCEVMALLIQDESVSWQRQQAFFETHVGSWMEKFFEDLEKAESALFYRSVGKLGQTFMTLEKTYLTMLV
jgi:TorA maturation chaperone TorD